MELDTLHVPQTLPRDIIAKILAKIHGYVRDYYIRPLENEHGSHSLQLPKYREFSSIIY
jgi:hypothetical protein